MVVLDADGAVLLVNLEAQRILHAGTPFCITDGQLTSPDPAVRRQLLQARLNAARGRPDTTRNGGAAFCVARRPGRPTYHVFVTRVAGSPDAGWLPPGSSAIITITDPVAYFKVSLNRLREFGLTAAEARLCEALVRAGSLPRSADELGIAHSTARSHLKTIFEKLGVTTQIELVQSLVASFPDPAGSGPGRVS